ncbi:MAG: hypothetical protein KC482_05100 [Dehalococcoidia bacterium]|nr:hypothetical protein [Dehalococcoidia bacterium]MCA9825101.1 hypothetical protein [Dehalococcoidia bacterium]MCA9844717.1 hypothetical protein [Dehalococcoidia bacterium]MCA9852963.1 hypothetical protein [Dehalococcoidia bacterium]
MSEEKHQPGRYEIRVRGRLPGRWGAWFAGMSLTYETHSGETVLRGPVADQAALHGLLARFRDLGIPIVSVFELGSDSDPP